jgi:hypothetical protein
LEPRRKVEGGESLVALQRTLVGVKSHKEEAFILVNAISEGSPGNAIYM